MFKQDDDDDPHWLLDGLEHLRYEADWLKEQYGILERCDEIHEVYNEDTGAFEGWVAHGDPDQVRSASLLYIDGFASVPEQQRHASHPMSWLDAFLERQVGSLTCRRVYSQIIADMREEYSEALSKGQESRTKWILARCYGSIVGLGATARRPAQDHPKGSQIVSRLICSLPFKETTLPSVVSTEIVDVEQEALGSGERVRLSIS